MNAELITAQQLFEPDGGYLEGVGGKFSIDFFSNNHVIEAAKVAKAKDIGDTHTADIATFIKKILRYPHIQIQTIKKHLFGPGSVTRLNLDQIMFYHGIDVALALSINPGLTEQLGNETRIQSLETLQRAGLGLNLGLLSRIEGISFQLPSEVPLNRSTLVPLFNVATAARLSGLADIPLDQFSLEQSQPGI